MTSMADEKSKLSTLDGLKERCEAAPRFGKNARALLLEGLRSTEGEFEFEERAAPAVCSSTERLSAKPAPNAGDVHLSQRHPDRPMIVADPLELFQCVPPVERHYINYDYRQKFPKIVRQTEVNTLTGKYLELLLRRTKLLSKEQWFEEIKQNEDLRAAAVKAADKNERLIYRESFRRVEYEKRMQTEVASEKFLDPSWREQQQQDDAPIARIESASSSSDVVNVKQLSELKTEPPAEPSVTSAEKDLLPSKSDLTSSIDRFLSEDRDAEVTTKNKRRRLEVVHEETEENECEKDSCPDNENQATALPQKRASKHGQDMPSTNKAHKCTSPDKKTTARSKDTEKRSRVLAFVKRILDPLFAAHLIDRETYKSIAKKAVEKVLAAHANDRNADFLIEESEKVTQLTQKYVKYYRKKPSSKASS